jgi:hypothetical protein
MFISKQEKIDIVNRLNTLEAMVKSLHEQRRIKREKSLEASRKYYQAKKKEKAAA